MHNFCLPFNIQIFSGKLTANSSRNFSLCCSIHKGSPLLASRFPENRPRLTVTRKAGSAQCALPPRRKVSKLIAVLLTTRVFVRPY